MISLNTPTLTALGQCTGFTVEDTTNYNQLPNPSYGGFLNVFSLANFSLGVRVIKVTYPDGSIIYYLSNSQGGPVPNNPLFNIQFLDTRITLANNTNYTVSIYSTQQGVYTVSVIPFPSFQIFSSGFVQTNASIGDVFYVNTGISFILVRALVNNPLNNIFDATQWGPVANESQINYVSSTITFDCSATNLACIFDHIECAFCCGCCDDIDDNQNAIRILKASLMQLELTLIIGSSLQSQYNSNSLSFNTGAANVPPNPDDIDLPELVFIPDDAYLNKACDYYKSMSKLCNCNKLQPCSPCDKTSESEPNQTIQQSQINIAMYNIFTDNYVKKLNNQIILGKQLSSKDRKTLIELTASIVISNQRLSITAPNYNCLNLQIGFDTDFGNLPAIISNTGGGVSWSDTGKNNLPTVIVYNPVTPGHA